MTWPTKTKRNSAPAGSVSMIPDVNHAVDVVAKKNQERGESSACSARKTRPPLSVNSAGTTSSSGFLRTQISSARQPARTRPSGSLTPLGRFASNTTSGASRRRVGPVVVAAQRPCISTMRYLAVNHALWPMICGMGFRYVLDVTPAGTRVTQSVVKSSQRRNGSV